MQTRKMWLLLALLVAACNSNLTPDFEIFKSGTKDNPKGGVSGPLVGDIVQELTCELYDLKSQEHPIIVDLNLPRDPKLHEYPIPLYTLFNNIAFVSYATATLDVTNSQGLAPSINIIDPIYYPPAIGVAAANAVVQSSNTFNLTMALSGQLNEQQHRNIVLNLNWDFDKLANSECFNRHEGLLPRLNANLAGNLGLAEIVEMGLYADGRQQKVGVDPSSEYATQVSLLPPAALTGAFPLTSTLNGIFGSQVDFTITEGIGGGPTVNLLHFKGPGGGTAGGGGGGASSGASTGSSMSSAGGGGPGPLNYTRSTKDTLVMSFAPACLKNDGVRNDTLGKMSYLPKWAANLKCCFNFRHAKKCTAPPNPHKPFSCNTPDPAAGNHTGRSVLDSLPMPMCGRPSDYESMTAGVTGETTTSVTEFQSTHPTTTTKQIEQFRQDIRGRILERRLFEDSAGAKAGALGAAGANNSFMTLQGLGQP